MKTRIFIRYLPLVWVGIILQTFATTGLASCPANEPEVLKVPEKYPTISNAIADAKLNPSLKGKNVVIKVEWGIYNEDGKGVLIDRACTDLIGVPNSSNQKPIIQRSNFAGYEQAVVKIRNSGVRFEGFEINGMQQCNAYGILVLIAKYDDDITTDFSDIDIKKNTIRDIGKSGCKNAHGIVVWSAKEQLIKNVKVEQNVLYNLRLGNSESITIKNNIYNFFVNDNLISNTNNIGIDVVGYEENTKHQANRGEIMRNHISDLRPGNDAYPHVAGIYVDGGKNINISQNTVTRFGYGIQIASEQAQALVSDILITGNVITENIVAGIGIGHGEEQRSYVEKCTIYNNSVADNGSGTTKNGRTYDGGQIRLISHIKDGLRRIVIRGNMIRISNGRNIKRLIFAENCIWDGPKCVISDSKLDVAFSDNRFNHPDYLKAWFLSGSGFDGVNNGTRQILEKYFADFNRTNSLLGN